MKANIVIKDSVVSHDNTLLCNLLNIQNLNGVYILVWRWVCDEQMCPNFVS